MGVRESAGRVRRRARGLRGVLLMSGGLCGVSAQLGDGFVGLVEALLMLGLRGLRLARRQREAACRASVRRFEPRLQALPVHLVLPLAGRQTRSSSAENSVRQMGHSWSCCCRQVASAAESTSRGSFS